MINRAGLFNANVLFVLQVRVCGPGVCTVEDKGGPLDTFYLLRSNPPGDTRDLDPVFMVVVFLFLRVILLMPSLVLDVGLCRHVWLLAGWVV